MRLFRFLRIAFIAGFWWFFLRHDARVRGVRLRHALESLGPVFVKFGQLLSVRPDLVPEDIADELAKLQDSVPPFTWEEAAAMLDRAYGRSHAEVFASIEHAPVASASVAQVHFAVLRDGREAAVKILRPGIARVIASDVTLLYTMAGVLGRFVKNGELLRLREVVAEFEKTIAQELDLIHEAANASQLRRNFADARLLIVPDVYWEWCTREVMVMQRVEGIAVNDLPELARHGIDLKKLSRDGVEIFFTQVFRDGFFHADMHPGNILVAKDGRYCGVDFGIMGALSETDRNYLADNFMAFFRRDYRGVARAYIAAGWVPPETRVEDFEGAIRSVCEPVFDKPLREISFGKVLMRLFQVAGRYRIEVQPQLALLQKTLIQIEGLGRQLDPDLDLRAVAQPILERFMDEQLGLRGFVRRMREEAPYWARTVPQVPRLVHKLLDEDSPRRIESAILRLERVQRRQTRVLGLIVIVLALAVLVVGILLR
jgi:ubiquinone biosynthesis protein